MRLPLFSSREAEMAPNLVGIQHPALDMLPTILVCPLKEAEAVTHLRAPAWEMRGLIRARTFPIGPRAESLSCKQFRARPWSGASA